jgi:hypothetical protein
MPAHSVGYHGPKSIEGPTLAPIGTAAVFLEARRSTAGNCFGRFISLLPVAENTEFPFLGISGSTGRAYMRTTRIPARWPGPKTR